MKPTLVIIGTCYSSITYHTNKQCLIAQNVVSKEIFVVEHNLIHSPKITSLHELVRDYESVVLFTKEHEVKTHD